MSWYEGLDGWFQSKVFKANRRWSRQTRNAQRKTAVAQVVLESLSHNGEPPLPASELGRPRPPPLPDFQSDQPGDALGPDDAHAEFRIAEI